MNLIYITNILPFIANSGGTIVSKKVLEGLIENGHRIHLFFLDISDGTESMYYEEKYNGILESYNFVHNGNNVRSIKNFLKSVIKGVPLNVYRNSCNELKNKIRKLLETEQIDVIYCDHLEMIQYVPAAYFSKVLLFEHNIEYMIWRRYSRQLKNLFVKAGVYLESRRMETYEKRMCQSVKSVCGSPNDIEYLARIANRNVNEFVKVHLCGEDALLDLPIVQKRDKFTILFVATMTWQSNIDGINWFVKKVFPRISYHYPDVQLNIVGKLPQNHETILARDRNVNYLGFVESLESLYEEATVFICPLLYGSGTKIKVVNALYRGIPVVMTNIGAENIDVQNEKNAFVTDDADMFAEYILKLWEDDFCWKNISINGRKLAKKDFIWEKEINKIEKKMETF